MIIGINGYAGVGKDTVGKIIKELQPSKNWEIKKFAGKLKEVASILTGIPEKMFEDQKFKKTNLGKEWSYHGLPLSVRNFLQRLGTDALREGLHPNTWVNALMTQYKQTEYIGSNSEGADIYGYPEWIITDTRFPNEAKAIKNAGGIVIRIDRPGISAVNTHLSETALDNWNFDYKIMNGSDLTSLMFTVDGFLKKEKLK